MQSIITRKCVYRPGAAVSNTRKVGWLDSGIYFSSRAAKAKVTIERAVVRATVRAAPRAKTP